MARGWVTFVPARRRRRKGVTGIGTFSCTKYRVIGSIPQFAELEPAQFLIVQQLTDLPDPDRHLLQFFEGSRAAVQFFGDTLFFRSKGRYLLFQDFKFSFFFISQLKIFYEAVTDRVLRLTNFV